MEKINVWRIAIEKDKIVLYPKDGEKKEFDRHKWQVFLDDVRQLQVFKDYSLVLTEDVYACEIDEDRRRLFCGKRPEEVRIL